LVQIKLKKAHCGNCSKPGVLVSSAKSQRTLPWTNSAKWIHWFVFQAIVRTKQNAMSNEPAVPQRPPENRRSNALPAGATAPDFTLKSTPDQAVKLSDFRGQPVVLAFYPADWSPVCGDQMALYNEILPDFRELGAELIGISVDGPWCHAAFSRDRKLHFPLLADFEPKGAVARLYGVYRDADGTTERALFVINAEGVIHWSYVSPVGVNPGADGILSALEELNTKKEAK
jgi:peroxiredoxin